MSRLGLVQNFRIRTIIIKEFTDDATHIYVDLRAEFCHTASVVSCPWLISPLSMCIAFEKERGKASRGWGVSIYQEGVSIYQGGCLFITPHKKSEKTDHSAAINKAEEVIALLF
jgi:hypothetical protein